MLNNLIGRIYNKVAKSYMNSSIHNKMMMIILFVLAVSVVVLSYMNISVLNRSLIDISNKQTVEMANQVTLRIENYIAQTDRLISLIESESSIVQFTEGIIDEALINKNLERYTSNNRYIAGILLVDKYGYMLSNTMTKLEDNPLTMESWYIQAVAEPNEIHLFSKLIGRNITSFYNSYKADNILTVTKAIKNKENEVVGVILIDMKLDSIESIISSAELGKSGFLYIADNHGEVVYAPTNDIVYRIHQSMISDDKIVSIKGETYQIIATEAGISNWQIVGVFPQDTTLSIIVELITYFIVFAVLIFIVGLALSSYLTKSLTKPIKELRSVMAIAEGGELNVRFESEYDDEISKLGGSFNKMIDSIENLLKLVYKEQKGKREAELRAFQAQIKPHFLYNTLDTINWMALEYGASEIVEVIDSLTNLFRISLSKGSEIITLENEIKHVKSYLLIQKVRYEDQFDYTINYDPDIIDLKIIKLVIQPLVENAIYHGIKGLNRVGKIQVNIYCEGGTLKIAVVDNGYGMHDLQVQKLNDIFDRRIKKDDKSGIGLFNVNERIKLNYGNDYGLHVTSTIDKGTTVILTHKLVK